MSVILENIEIKGKPWTEPLWIQFFNENMLFWSFDCCSLRIGSEFQVWNIFMSAPSMIYCSFHSNALLLKFATRQTLVHIFIFFCSTSFYFWFCSNETELHMNKISHTHTHSHNVKSKTKTTSNSVIYSVLWFMFFSSHILVCDWNSFSIIFFLRSAHRATYNR